MKKTFLLISLGFLFLGVALAQRPKSTLLPQSQAKSIANQCSRKSPSDYTDVWVPKSAEITAMESKLGNISKLKVESCCIVGKRITNPGDWYMQYIGLMWHKRKIIYISATSTDTPEYKEIDNTGKVLADWRTVAVQICDGGNAWGVIYDVESGSFSDLAVNGVG